MKSRGTSQPGIYVEILIRGSEDPKSLIRQGSGYWRYVPVENGMRFFTWYDYQVRFGAFGRLVDRLAGSTLT